MCVWWEDGDRSFLWLSWFPAPALSNRPEPVCPSRGVLMSRGATGCLGGLTPPWAKGVSSGFPGAELSSTPGQENWGDPPQVMVLD